MDVVIARIVHIFAGIGWAGAGFLALLVISPWVRQMQAQGNGGAANFYGTSRWSAFMAGAGVLTVLAGLYLYFRLSNGFQNSWLSSNGMAVLGIGAVAGVLALIHGGAILGRMQGEMSKFAATIQGAPTAEQRTRLAALAGQLQTHTYISFALVVIAVAGMAIARYVS